MDGYKNTGIYVHICVSVGVRKRKSQEYKNLIPVPVSRGFHQVSNLNHWVVYAVEGEDAGADSSHVPECTTPLSQSLHLQHQPLPSSRVRKFQNSSAEAPQGLAFQPTNADGRRRQRRRYSSVCPPLRLFSIFLFTWCLLGQKKCCLIIFKLQLFSFLMVITHPIREHLTYKAKKCFRDFPLHTNAPQLKESVSF